MEAPAGFKAVKSQENSHEAMAWRSLGVVTALLDPEELPVEKGQNKIKTGLMFDPLLAVF